MVSASLTGRGGTVRADIRLEGVHRDRIREVLITGDFFITPPRVVFDLEASLRDLNVATQDRQSQASSPAHAADFLSLSARRLSPGDRDGAATAGRKGGRQLMTMRRGPRVGSSTHTLVLHARSYSRLMSRHAVIVGGALALAGAGPLSRTGSAAEKSFLLHGLPEAALIRSRRGTLCRAKRVDQAHYRPPNYETPPTHFTSEFTPNKSFLSAITSPAFGKKSTPRSGSSKRRRWRRRALELGLRDSPFQTKSC